MLFHDTASWFHETASLFYKTTTLFEFYSVTKSFLSNRCDILHERLTGNLQAIKEDLQLVCSKFVNKCLPLRFNI